MTGSPQPHGPGEPPAETPTLAPLSGEAGIPDVAAPSRTAVSRKGVLAVAMLVLSLIVVSALAIHRFAASARHDGAEDRLNGDKPAAAAAEPRKLEMHARPAAASAPSTAPRIPGLLPDDDDVEPIGVRRTGAADGTPVGPGAGPARTSPEDAPVLLVTTPPLSSGAAPVPHAPGDARSSDDVQDPLAATSRHLQAYQRQLQGVLDNLAQSTDLATRDLTARDAAPATTSSPPLAAGRASQVPGGSVPAGLFGGQLQGSATPRVSAALLGNRSLTLPKGTAFTCALKTRVVSATSGLVGCQVQRHVYGDDGRVLLIERGSHLDGEYRIAVVRPGTVRIPVLWTRLRTPLGVTVDLESPATGPLGESGIDGHVDNRWSERLGAAMLLSLIDDSVKVVLQNQTQEHRGDTLVLSSTTANTSKLAEKVLDSTINIPPLVYQNQGGIVGIHVARDVDFSSVYTLAPSSTGLHQPAPALMP
ncbi:MAG TPA: type IV secretion system protein VirB10 [Roseateles sp.]|uniref:type IV secretion system protein VirB10 n=1 Tax=Roseateles sp. TaxID=1971397 RepID=UPI002ED92881